MKKFALRPLVAALVLTAPVMSAFATDGYFSHGYGMKAKGMGGAATASTDNAFAGANNPATAAFAGNRTEGGIDWFSPKRSTDAAMGGPGTITSDSNNFLIPEFGYNRTYDAKTSYGLTVYGNGGMNTDYPTNPVGGSTAMGVNLQQLVVAPTLSYKLDETQSVGVSPLFIYQTINIKGISHFGDMRYSQNPVKLSNNGTSSSTGMGVRLGYFAKLNDRLDIGVSYSPKTKMSKFDEYTGLFNSSFDIPENYNLGAAIKLTPGVKLSMDYQRINYNKVKAIGAPTANLLACQANSSCLGGANGPGFGWQNINVIKLGVEWQQTAALTLRAGFNRSDNPVKSEDVTFNIMAPGIMTKHYTFGGTYALDKEREVTLAYMYAPESTVTGTNLFEPARFVPPGSKDTIRMKQQSLGVQYAWKF
jgi:long-chain fatty acid transport protein